MEKQINSSVKKVLNKKEQKAIVGGMCYDPETQQSSYPVICYVNGVRRKVCSHLCD